MVNSRPRGFTIKRRRTEEEIFMAKASSRKHATHHRKVRAHHAVKTHARRSHASSSPSPGASGPIEIRPEPGTSDEDFNPRSESRVVDDPVDDEVGIYGVNRGETAG